MPRQIFNGLMPRQIYNGLMPRQKRLGKRTPSVQVSHLQHRRPITSSFLARHAKSSALLGRSVCTAGSPRRRACRGGSFQGRFSTGLCQGRFSTGLCQGRNGRRIVLDPRRCNTWKDRGRFGGRFSRDLENPQPFWRSPDVQRALLEGVRAGGGGLMPR